jgi:hypothetical protein
LAIFGRRLDDIDAACLDGLVSNAVQEDRQLDYKEKLPSEADKQEFLADVASFANTTGGDLIYGIREARDNEGKPTGEPAEVIGLPNINLHDERLRLENLIRDGIRPRVAITFHEVERGTRPPCLVIRVPRSWVGPHLVVFKGHDRFYGRNSGGKFRLDYEQIRDAFSAGESGRERVRAFRADRLMRVLGGDTPVPLGDSPKLIFHSIPIRPDDVSARFRATPQQQIIPHLQPIAGSVGRYYFNLEGFVVVTRRSDPARDCYVQLFRDGGIEAASVGAFDIYKPQSYGPGFNGHGLERELIEAFTRFQRAWQVLNVEPPMTLGLTLTGVSGVHIFPVSERIPLPPATVDREVVITPDVVVDDLSAPPDVVLQPLFDLVWNAGGWSESPHYRGGRWQANR